MDGLTRWQGAFIFSVIFSLFFLQIPPFSLLIFGLIVSFLLSRHKFYALSGLLAGFCWFFLHAHWTTAWQLPAFLYKQSVEIQGQVINIPTVQDDNIRFQLKVEHLAGVPIEKWQKVHLRLNWRTTNLNSLGAGDTIKFNAKLKPSYGFANQGGFSYQKWLLSQNIGATGYIDTRLPVIKIHDQKDKRQQLFNDLSRIKQSDKPLDYLGLLVALAMGEKQLINEEQWKLIRATGIGHLLAISGLHIGMMFVFARYAALWLTKLVVVMTNLKINAMVFSLLAGFIAAGFYAYLAGFAITTVRALVMLSFLLLFILSNHTNNGRGVILHSLCLLLIFDPLAVLQPSIWLSFIAVIAILLSFWWLQFKKEVKQSKFKFYLYSLFTIQLALFIAMMPLSSLIFSGFSLSGSWVNIIAVPWVSFVTVPLTLIALLMYGLNLDGLVLLSLANESLRWLFWLLELPMAAQGWHSVHAIAWYYWLLAIFALVIIVVVHINTLRIVGYVLLIPFALSWLQPLKNDNSWTLNVFDVGQGLAVAIEKNQQILLYDLGPRYKSGFNTAEQVILPYLNHQNFNVVDLLIISHADSDHAGGYQSLLQQIRVNKIIAPQELVKMIPNEIEHQLCVQSDFKWQGLDIEILSPQDSQQKLSRNDGSCVVKVSDGKQGILLPGDISKRIEKRLVAQYGRKLKSNILIAPHHGSNSSSSDIFIANVDPTIVVFSSGFLNRYGFPKQKVVSRYQNRKVFSLNSAKTGQIKIELGVKNTSGMSIKTYRQDMAAYWYLNQ